MKKTAQPTAAQIRSYQAAILRAVLAAPGNVATWQEISAEVVNRCGTIDNWLPVRGALQMLLDADKIQRRNNLHSEEYELTATSRADLTK